jgi:hypothetical protein
MSIDTDPRSDADARMIQHLAQQVAKYRPTAEQLAPWRDFIVAADMDPKSPPAWSSTERIMRAVSGMLWASRHNLRVDGLSVEGMELVLPEVGTEALAEGSPKIMGMPVRISPACVWPYLSLPLVAP